MPDAADITFLIVGIPGLSGSPTPGGPTAVPSRAVTPPVKPTPTATQGLGGS